MALKVRDFLARVMVGRPDILQNKGEEYGLWCIRETIRTICRQTSLAIEDLGVLNLTANAHSITLVSTGNEIGMVKKVAVASLPGSESYPTSYAGVFDASTGDITPHNGAVEKIITGNANLFTANKFYVCSVAGTLDVDSVPNPVWEVGDVILTNGTHWQQYKRDGFTTISIASQRSVDHSVDKNQSNRCLPLYCTQEGDVLSVFPPPRYDTVVSVVCSIVPNLIDWSQTVPQDIEMDDVPLPVSAENAILYGAMEMIFTTPSSSFDARQASFNSAQASKYGVMFAREMTGLRAIALLGQSGSAWYVPTNFTGRQNTSIWRTGSR